ncbi:MAG TPA: serine hydrolase [Streptosporangiaceae bacterium]|nr:serine hydrolase [Streptosporangiaceae bacterium]
MSTWRARGRVLRAVRGIAVAAVLPGVMTATAAPALAWVAPFADSQPAVAPSSPPISVFGGELVNASTGASLWAQGLGISRPMGSITKVMTALVVLQAGGLNRKIEVTKAAVRYVSRDGASSAGLIPGDMLTVRQLLAAMLIPSGCDAAYLLATAYGPGRPAFIAKMNATAAELGMTSTHFTSFDGMPYPTEHSTYSTPADLITLGLAAMKYPVFQSIVAMRKYRLRATTSHHAYLWQQTNVLIGSYPGALGVKTGDTKAAGNCLLFEATRRGVTLIGVVLHASPTSNPGSAIVAARRLLNWAFARM